MNTQVQSAISSFQFQPSFELRAILINGEPWFVAADVCSALDLGNVSLAVNGRADRVESGLDEDEKGIASVNTPSGEQQMLIINESGLYALIFKSRKPEAKKFKKWVTSEVLPTIRKTGSYTIPRNVITPEQKAALFAIVAKRAGDNGKIRAQLWSRHNHHFRIAKYEELLAIHFDEAVHYLETLELSTPRTEALPAPTKECQQAMNLVNSMQDLSLLSGTVNYDQVRDGLRHLLIHLGQHQPYAQVKPAVTVLEATERMLCRLWTMIDESSFRVGMLQNIGKSGRPLTDGNIETIGNINSILSRKMMHVELPVI